MDDFSGREEPLDEEPLDHGQLQRQYQTGKRIVIAVVIITALQILSGQVFAIVLHNYQLNKFLGLLLWAFILIKLYYGKTWAKVVFVVMSIIGVISLVALQAVQTPALPEVPAGLKPFIIWDAWVNAALYVISNILLFTASAKAFMDGQQVID